MNNQTSDRLVKIRFDLNPNDWKDLKSETVWASAVSPGKYSLRNSPFYIYGVSAEDVVYASESEGELRFQGVSTRGGHSTYRILLRPGETIKSPNFLKEWAHLQKLGCTYELAKTNWLAVDVPPASDIFAVYKSLENGDAAGVWTFEEAHCGHPVKTTELIPPSAPN